MFIIIIKMVLFYLFIQYYAVLKDNICFIIIVNLTR